MGERILRQHRAFRHVTYTGCRWAIRSIPSAAQVYCSDWIAGRKKAELENSSLDSPFILQTGKRRGQQRFIVA